jgi:hypothetical protein
LIPQDYYLTLDQSSYDANLISEQKLPIKTKIEAQKTDTLKISLIKPIKIKGKIFYKKSEQIQSKEFSNKMPDLLLKLENGKDVFYTIINNSGAYSFSEIRPGDWTLSIVKKGLEQKFIFPDSLKQLKLKSGENLTIDFVIEEKIRKTNFSEKKINIKIKN